MNREYEDWVIGKFVTTTNRFCINDVQLWGSVAVWHCKHSIFDRFFLTKSKNPSVRQTSFMNDLYKNFSYVTLNALPPSGNNWIDKILFKNWLMKNATPNPRAL